MIIMRNEVFCLEAIYHLLMEYIDIWGYTAIIILMAMESACMPVPSELVFGFAGYLVYLGRLDFTAALIAGVIGGLIGSAAAYLAGYYGGRPFIAKYGRYILLSQNHVDLAQRWFDRHGLQATFFSRLLPVVRTFISLPAGFARVNFWKFVILTVLGSIPWTAGLIYMGKLLGANWQMIEAVGHKITLAAVVLLVLLGIYLLKRNRKQSNPE